MGPVVRVGDRADRWPAAPQGHLQGVDDELGPHVVADGPAHHHPAERLQHHGEVDLAVAGGMLGDVHHPQPVRFGHIELPVHEIFGRLGGRVAAGAAPPATPVDTLDAGLAHQPLDALAAAPDALAEAQLGVHPRRPIRPAAGSGGCRRWCWSGRRRREPGPTPGGRARRRTRTSTPSSRDNTSPPTGPGSPGR